MPLIEGDVDVVGIANLLQAIANEANHGFLTVSRGSDRRTIEFADKGIRLVSGTRRANPIGQILVRTGRLTPKQLDDVLVVQQATRIPLGKLVTDMGILTPETIEMTLREQVAEEIYDLFTWIGAQFEFRLPPPTLEDAPEGPLAEIYLDSNMMGIMLEASRRIDELSQIRGRIPDNRLIPERLELPAALDDPNLDENAVKEILPLVDGKRSVDEILERSLYPAFWVLRTLYILAERGSLTIRDRGEADTKPITVFRRTRLSSLKEDPARSGRLVVLSKLETFRSALGLLLRNQGFDVIECSSFRKSLDVICMSCVDLVVVDLAIEKEDSLSLCDTIRESSALPLILLTGNSSREAVANALKSGAEFVLTKPIKEDLLVDRIQEVLNSKTVYRQ